MLNRKGDTTYTRPWQQSRYQTISQAERASQKSLLCWRKSWSLKGKALNQVEAPDSQK